MARATTQTRTRADWKDAEVPNYEWSADTFRAVIPEEMLELRQWMGALPGDKNPFAPAGEKNPDCECKAGDCPADRADDPDCKCDGRFKWGYSGHYVTGREIRQALEFTRVEYPTFIFHAEKDGYIFFDLDDVRCPETGEVHPVALSWLQILGPTWVEVSSSGTGLHVVYKGELPGNLVEAKPTIDSEPWGANDELPVIEIYQSKRKVGVLTERKVPGAPDTIEECGEDALSAMLDATGYYSPGDEDTGNDADNDGNAGFDGSGESGGSDAETTDDMDEVFDALNRLDARDVADKTIVQSWTDPAGTEHRAFLPTWGSSSDGGTANYVTENAWTDGGNDPSPGCGYGGPVVMAAIDLGVVDNTKADPGSVSGADWLNCVEWLRTLGFSIPRPASGDENGGEGQ